MDDVGVGNQADARLVVPAADLDGLLDEPWRGVRQDRAGAEDLLDGRPHVVLIAIAHALGHLRMTGEQHEGEAKRRGSRLVTGDQQRHQLVAQLLGRHRRAVLVARRQQHRQHVVAVLAVAGAALVDQLEDELVGPLAERQELRPAAVAAEIVLRRRDDRDRARHVVEDLGQLHAQRVQAWAGVQAEDRAQDHLERERLEARVERHGLPGRPLVQLALGHLGDEVGQARHLLAVESGQHQAPLRKVRALVQQDHRAGAEHGLEDARALAGMEHVGRRGEDLADVVGIRVHDERRRGQQADRVAAPEAAAAALVEGEWTRPPADRLQHAWEPRPGWELRAHRDPPCIESRNRVE